MMHIEQFNILSAQFRCVYTSQTQIAIHHKHIYTNNIFMLFYSIQKNKYKSMDKYTL